MYIEPLQQLLQFQILLMQQQQVISMFVAYDSFCSSPIWLVSLSQWLLRMLCFLPFCLLRLLLLFLFSLLNFFFTFLDHLSVVLFTHC